MKHFKEIKLIFNIIKLKILQKTMIALFFKKNNIFLVLFKNNFIYLPINKFLSIHLIFT